MFQQLFGLFVCVVSFVASAPAEFYASRYEHIDIDTALSNKRLIQNYGDCLLFKKPCAPQGKELRDILPEALETTCARCTEKQIVYAMRVVHRLQKEYPELYAQLSERWDPTGKYLRAFEELFNSPNKVERSPAPPTATSPTTEIPLFNRFNDNNANDISPNDISSTGDLDNIDQSNFPNASSTSINSVSVQPVTTTTSVPASSPATTRPLMFMGSNAQHHWLDVLGSQVLQTAGKIADMFVSTVEVVVGAKYRRHAALRGVTTTTTAKP
uniref:Chemosensory protein 8 n=1 Tax=Chrysopa pallens TaxID=417485 RepID=A0A191US25_CHRPA|nr:chemosensory protein 8 [Chrysopa pallens]